MKKIKYLISLPSFFLFTSLVKAQNLIDSEKISNVSNEFGGSAGFTSISLGKIISVVISIALSLLALIFLVLTIMAGFKWMTAGGNEEEVKKAQTSLKNSVMGLIIVLAAYAITYFIFSKLPFSAGTPLGGAQAV